MFDKKKFIIFIGVFLAAFYIPLSDSSIQVAILEAFHMLQEYAREHVLYSHLGNRLNNTL